MPLIDSRRGLQIARASSIGLEVAGSVVIGLLAGSWVDRRLGTRPMFLFAGLLLGMFAAGRALYRLAKGREIQKP